MAGAKFQKPPQAPPLFTHTPESLGKTTDRLMKDNKSLMDKIVAENKPDNATFQSVMLPMAREDNVMSLEAHIIGFYQAVSTDAKLRRWTTMRLRLR
jgi:metallopeptidase MepB